MGKAATKLREMRVLLNAVDPIKTIDGLVSKPRDLIALAPDQAAKAKLLQYVAFHAHKNGRHLEAFQDFKTCFELTGDTGAITNALICARHAKKEFAEAERHALLRLVGLHGDKISASNEAAELFDVLCHNSGAWGNNKAAAQYGARALAIKDGLQSPSFELKDRSRPEFNFDTPQRNVIAFSLFGSQPRYLHVALENVKACPYVFPGWSCRFYIDNSVPEDAIKQLAQAGAQLQMLPKPHDPKTASGLFWRFLVASDPNVDFFAVRDADSLISVREKNAVDEWVDSDRDFHALRDFYTHSELMLAGLWGGVAGRIADIGGLISTYHKKPKPNVIGVHNHDQLFLRQVIWPSIKSNLMQHDSVFDVSDKRDFPAVGKIQPVRHVGQNMGIFMRNGGKT